MQKEKFYLTTAIAYTSSTPHFGNVYEVVMADALCRFKRALGYDVFFQTGTDEHGQKIEDKAKQAGLTPKEYADNVAGKIKEIYDLMNTSYDNFIRTTDDYHEKQVQKIFKKFYDNNDIYKGKYQGNYCKACESFITNSQLKDNCCPECRGPVTIEDEEVYFFKMSKYADRLLKHIEDNPDFISPESRKNEMINNFIKPGIKDLCVSRTSFKWGIPVDFDPKHVIYVWIDALSNYITGIGYDCDGNHREQFKKLWPADLHVIGKDILRFHTIYWPIMLMALDLPLPKQVFGHPWFLVGESKMSKSKNNTIYAQDLVAVFGVDAVRYIMLHEMPYNQDGTVTHELMIERINTDLANTLGNLVNRSITMVNKYFEGSITNKKVNNSLDESLVNYIYELKQQIIQNMEVFKIAEALENIMKIFKRLNKYIDETCPWILAKDETQKDRLETVLYHLISGIKYASILLESFMPDTAKTILKQLEINTYDFSELDNFYHTTSYHVTAQPTILFKRLDLKETLNNLKQKTIMKSHTYQK